MPKNGRRPVVLERPVRAKRWSSGRAGAASHRVYAAGDGVAAEGPAGRAAASGVAARPRMQ